MKKLDFGCWVKKIRELSWNVYLLIYKYFAGSKFNYEFWELRKVHESRFIELKLWNKKRCSLASLQQRIFVSLFHFLLFDSHSCQTSNGIWHLHVIPLRSAKSLSEFLDDSFEIFFYFFLQIHRNLLATWWQYYC